MRVLAVLLVLAGCHGGGETHVLDGGHGNGTDSGPGSPGLFVSWQDSPSLPGSLGNDITVTSVSFQVNRLQVIADAGVVERPTYLLTWSAVMRPEEETFPAAPAGVYSKVSIDLGGSQVAYTTQINGTMHTSGGGGPGPHLGPGPGGGGGGSDDNQPFTIIDRKPLTISITCDEELEANAPKSFAVRLDLSAAITGINFANLTKDGTGTLVLDENSVEYAGFRERLMAAFAIQD